MSALVLADELGPRARRRVFLISAAASVVLLAMLAVAGLRIYDKDQLEWEKWEPFTDVDVLKFFWNGLVATLKAALAAMGLALLGGAALALLRLSQTALVRWVATAWVEFFRGVPLLLLIFFTFFALPKYDIDISPYQALVLALTLYNSAVLGEIFRAGILSLDRGQTEAAYAVGMGYWQAMLLVVIPQAARRMIPAIVSQLITLLKDTSLAFAVTYEELLGRSEINGIFYNNLLQSYFVVALMYIAVNFTLSRIARRLEVRQRRRLGAGAIVVGGIEDLTAVEMAAAAQLHPMGATSSGF